MNQKLKEFIESNIELIEQGEMPRVYALIESPRRSELTEILLAADIDVFSQMTVIPTGFCSRSDIETISIPAPIKRIKEFAFKGCSNLKSITLPNTLEYIGTEAFSFCSELKSIVIPDNVKTIDDTAFFSCTSLETVSLGNSLEFLAPSIFAQCVRLKSITIPLSMFRIGANIFNKCYGLETIDYAGTRDQWNQIHKDSKWDNGSSLKDVRCTDGVILIAPF